MSRTLAGLIETIEAHDLAFRGAFHPRSEDGVPALADGTPAETVLLVGFTGRMQWPAFEASAEAGDGLPHPLDRYGQRQLHALAVAFGGRALSPSEGPPWWPFQRWAQRAEPVSVSPLGILIHPDWGLWHSYRCALAFRERLELPAMPARASPCTTCAEKPCLTTCPVSAFSNAGYDVAGCRSHIAAPAGSECISGGCLARVACPVGAGHRYAPAQAAFQDRKSTRLNSSH